MKQNDYAGINTPTLLLLGDRDNMVSQDATVAVFRSLPNARMGMLPGTPHLIERVDFDPVGYMIK